MKFIKFGKQTVSKISLGTWSLGGISKGNLSYGNISECKSQKILEYAFDKKINFFDTANVYGLAEKRLGKFIKNINRNKIFLATKVGCISYNKKKNFKPKIIYNQVVNSIKNLNDSYIDLVQLYGPNPNDKDLAYSIEELLNLKEKKLIKNIGVSLQNPNDYINLRKLNKFDFVQFNFNLLDTRVLKNNIFNTMLKDKTITYIRTVLNFGIFTEEFLKKQIKFNKNDHRKKWDNKQISLWKKNLYFIKSLNKRKIEDTCYKFGNSFKFSGTIIGATKTSHIDEAIKSSNFKPLKVGEKNKIIKISTNFEYFKIKKPFLRMKT